MPFVHRPPCPSGAIDPSMSAGLAAVSHDLPFQCITVVAGILDGDEMVRSSHASFGPAAVRFEYDTVAPFGRGSSGRPVVVHFVPFHCRAEAVPRAQMSSGATVLSSVGTAGSFTFAQLRPL